METGLETRREFAGLAEHDFYEYLLVANPDHAVIEKIMEEKNRFSKDYHYKMAAKTHPHITIADFLARETMEETLVRWMHRIINNHRCFTAVLNNYSGFPPHTIFVRVQDYEPFRELAEKFKSIEPYIRDNGCPPIKLITRPHVTIARRLTPPVYEKAIVEYSQRTFHETFLVNELLLLKRRHQFDECRGVALFSMLPEERNLFN